MQQDRTAQDHTVVALAAQAPGEPIVFAPQPPPPPIDSSSSVEDRHVDDTLVVDGTAQMPAGAGRGGFSGVGSAGVDGTDETVVAPSAPARTTAPAARPEQPAPWPPPPGPWSGQRAGGS